MWRGPSILNTAWLWRRTSRRILDEDVSLLQLAEAFARKIDQERPLIAERINHPETIRNVSRSQLHSQADLNPHSVARGRKGSFSRLPLLFGDAQSSSASASSTKGNINTYLRPRGVGEENPTRIARLPPMARHRPQDPRTLVVFSYRRLYSHDASSIGTFRRSPSRRFLTYQL